MMADSKQHVKTTSHKRGSDKKRHFPHLKPLSIYSHMVLSKATSSDNLPCSPGGPTWNIKVELSNSRAPVGQKRRLDDSCLDETYDTPLKKPCLDKHPSSGSGFVLDSSDTVRQVKFVSSQSSSVAIEEIERIEKTLSDQKALGLEWINSSDETDGQSRVSLPDVHSNSPVITSIKDNADVIVFDYDVDGIMCLSPIDNADVSADGLEDFIQICQPSYEELLPVEKNAECSHTQNASDEGYFTKSYSKVTMESELTKNEEMYFIKSYKTTFGNLSNEKTPPVSIPVMSTPVSKFRDLVKRSPLLSLKLDEGSWLCEPEKGSADCSSSPHLNIDAGNTEELPVLNVNKSKEGQVVPKGTSIHKLILCHSPEKHTATQVEKDEDVLSVSQLQTDSPKEEMFAEETDDADSFNSTLPLRVQVKSKVVLPNKQQPEAVKATAHTKPEKKAVSEGQRNVFSDVARPVVLYSEDDWEKEQKVYVDSVTRHMKNNAENGVMSELLHLMNTVANQGRGSDGIKWQHPSDLTRRNYRSSSRLLSLDEWQKWNSHNHRRFAKVPLMFKRSPVL